MSELRSGPDLRHHAARRRADRRRRLQRARQARDRRGARRGARRRHRGGLPGELAAASSRRCAAWRAQVRDARICALARAVPKDVEAAGEALRAAAAPRIHVFVNASDVQLAHQLRATPRERRRHGARRWWRARATSPTTSSSARWTRRAPTASSWPSSRRPRSAAGARTINLPDTVGLRAARTGARALRVAARARVPELADAVLSFHGQDDLGLATANALAAVAGGRAPGRGRGERDRRARGQHRLRGGGDGAPRPRRRRSGVRDRRRRARRSTALSQLVAERSGIAVAAEQGGGRRQRLPPRLGHPPGRRPQGARDLRVLRPGRDRAPRRHADRARKALRARRIRRARRGARAARRRARRSAAPSSRFQALAAAGVTVGDDELRAVFEEAERAA